jgi:hypothetical protein
MPKNPVIAKALVDQDAIFFASNNRKESEIVLDTSMLTHRNRGLGPVIEPE